MRRPVGVKSILFYCVKPPFLLARSALSPCFHPHSRGAIVSLGASWAFSVQPVLLIVYRPVVVSWRVNPGQATNAVTKLAFGVLSFHFLERFWGYFAFLSYPTAATVIRLLLAIARTLQAPPSQITVDTELTQNAVQVRTSAKPRISGSKSSKFRRRSFWIAER